MDKDVIINWVGDTIPQLQVKLNLERDWMEDGICFEAADDIRDLFFEVGRGEGFIKACTLCNICPVKSLCYAYALIYGERGTWGGTNQTERDERRPFVVEEVVELWPLLYKKWQGLHAETVAADILAAQDVNVPGPTAPHVASEDHERARARAAQGMHPGSYLGRRNPRVVSAIRKEAGDGPGATN